MGTKAAPIRISRTSLTAMHDDDGDGVRTVVGHMPRACGTQYRDPRNCSRAVVGHAPRACGTQNQTRTKAAPIPVSRKVAVSPAISPANSLAVSPAVSPAFSPAFSPAVFPAVSAQGGCAFERKVGWLHLPLRQGPPPSQPQSAGRSGGSRTT